jgi:hypothetical protein
MPPRPRAPDARGTQTASPGLNGDYDFLAFPNPTSIGSGTAAPCPSTGNASGPSGNTTGAEEIPSCSSRAFYSDAGTNFRSPGGELPGHPRRGRVYQKTTAPLVMVRSAREARSSTISPNREPTANCSRLPFRRCQSLFGLRGSRRPCRRGAGSCRRSGRL